jgi:4-hydroxybenzoate polyprenyltransferase
MVQDTISMVGGSRESETKPQEPFTGVHPVTSPPLVVDLDGTLLKTDLALESLLGALKQDPGCALYLLAWLWKGKAYLKQQLARRVSLDASLLPYRAEFVDYLRAQRAEGRRIVLATASDEQLARRVADHLLLFDAVIASDGVANLSGECKRDCLVREFGERGFDYAGNARPDLAVWASARRAVVVNPGRGVEPAARKVAQVERVVASPPARLVDYVKALRPQQWLKNLLIFVPLFAAHRFHEPALLATACLAFVAFCCCASGGYLFNDLADLAADRRHPRKRFRPIAAGDLPLPYALAMVPVLAILGCLLGALVSPLFVGFLLMYLAITLSYSLYLDRVVLLDVLVLAGLYTLRIAAGSAAVAIWPSHWLLAFSTFLFLSLALVKRYSELVVMRDIDGENARARSYELSDGELLAAKGTASGYLAVLVLALYITSSTSRMLYGRHEVLWLLCPLLLYWIGHIWLVAHRGWIHGDPIVYATTDRTSRILLLLMLGTVVLAL